MFGKGSQRLDWSTEGGGGKGVRERAMGRHSEDGSTPKHTRTEQNHLWPAIVIGNEAKIADWTRGNHIHEQQSNNTTLQESPILVTLIDMMQHFKMFDVANAPKNERKKKTCNNKEAKTNIVFSAIHRGKMK